MQESDFSDKIVEFPLKKFPIATEHEEQVTFMQWLSIEYPQIYKVTYSVPNGAHLARGFLSYKRLEKEGLKKGAPDIIIDYASNGWHGARIEMKRKGNKPSPEQIEFLNNLHDNKYCCAICYNAKEAQSFIKYYLGK